MTLPTRPGCSCATCTHLTSSVCEKSSCAHALYHGYDCNAEADARRGTTRRYRAKDNPIEIKDFVKEAK